MRESRFSCFSTHDMFPTPNIKVLISSVGLPNHCQLVSQHMPTSENQIKAHPNALACVCAIMTTWLVAVFRSNRSPRHFHMPSRGMTSMPCKRYRAVTPHAAWRFLNGSAESGGRSEQKTYTAPLDLLQETYLDTPSNLNLSAIPNRPWQRKPRPRMSPDRPINPCPNPPTP